MIKTKPTVQWTKAEAGCCLFKVGFMNRNALCFDGVSYAWFQAMRTASQDCITRDDLAIDFVVKKIKIIQHIFQKKQRWGLVNHLRRQVRYVEKDVFWAERQRSSETYFTFFLAEPAMQTSVPLHICFTTRVVNEFVWKSHIDSLRKP